MCVCVCVCAVDVGLLCVIVGVVVVLMDVLDNERLFAFFNVDSTCDLEEFVVSK